MHFLDPDIHVTGHHTFQLARPLAAAKSVFFYVQLFTRMDFSVETPLHHYTSCTHLMRMMKCKAT